MFCVCHVHLIQFDTTYMCARVYRYAYMSRYLFILYVLSTCGMLDMELVAMCIKQTLKLVKSKPNRL